MKKQIMFLIQASNDDGENLDLFVAADGEASALDYWRHYYDIENPLYMPDRLIVVPMEDGDGCGGSIHWDRVIQMVYDRRARKSAGITTDNDSKTRGIIAALTANREG